MMSGQLNCLCVPITTYGGRGVSKFGVKKANHCIVYTGSRAPESKAFELPQPPELGMQAMPIRVDADDRTVRLDEMSRIDFAKPVNVEFYTVVKNFGKVHPHSIHALVSQFQNVMDPSRVRRVTAAVGRAPVGLESSRSRHWRAYSALVSVGWSHQQATAYVNMAVRGERVDHPGREEVSSDSEADQQSNMGA